MSRIEAWGNRVVDTVAGGLFLVIVCITFAQASMRYIFGGSLAWSEELNLLLWIWMIQAGAIRAVHMKMDFIVHLLPRRVLLMLIPCMTVIVIGLLALMTWGSWNLVQLTMHDYFIALDFVSVRYTYLALGLLGPLWIVVEIVHAVRALRELRQTWR